jgi:hypothetical protein
MAITRDTDDGKWDATPGLSSITLSYTLGVGAQLWAMVVAKSSLGIPNETSATYNSVTLQNWWQNTNASGVRMNTFATFDTGHTLTGDGAPHNMTIAFDKVCDVIFIDAVSFFGVSTAVPGDGLNASGTSTGPTSGSLSEAAGTLVVDAVGIIATVTPAIVAGGDRASIDAGSASGIGFGLSQRSGGSTFPMDWTIGSSQLWFSQSIVLTPAISPAVVIAYADRQRRV